MPNYVKAFIALGVLMALPLAIIYWSGSISLSTADFRGEVGEKERINANPDYRIAARDEFFQLCSTVKTQQQQVHALREQAKTATTPDERRRYTTGADALNNQMIANAESYNQKAQNTASEGQFRDSDLPYRLDPLTEEVKCAV